MTQGRAGALLVALALSACGAAESPDGGPAFDGERAFADLADLVALGPRPAGSQGAAAARRLLGERLRQAGWRVETHAFDARLPDGTTVPMQNLIGIRPGARPETILLITHYDTKRIPDVRFLGANDGASGCAVLLELARQLGSRSLEFTTWLVFADGEEATGPAITHDDGLYGSRALAARMAEEGTLSGVRALILVDMVGDRDLNVSVSSDSSADLERVLRDSAERLGLAAILEPERTGLIDDHTPFVEAGVPDVLALIDFQFGARRTPGPYWHTSADDLDAVSGESLNRVGQLLVESYAAIERWAASERAGAP